MDQFSLAVLLAMAASTAYVLRARDQSRRIALLGSHLRHYQIEKLMETLTEGYLRALGEADAERREQIWRLLAGTEASLCNQFNNFIAGFAKVDAADARISRLPLAWAIPYADRLFPAATFDVRRALALHAQGIGNAIRNAQGLSAKDRAYTVSAELLLMQHTCHWFCKSKAVASARMLARHQTPYAQLLASVAPQTREGYQRLLAG